MARVIVLGGGVGGLGAALGLASRGHDVVVVEQDPPPATTSGDEAFFDWDRRNVPQFRQAHGFSARSRTLLLQHAPGVLDRLAADGIFESNGFKMATPPEMHTPEDEAFTGFMSRRPAFELALRLEAEADPRITIVCPAVVSGLVVPDGSTPPVVKGLRLVDGRELTGDVVVDAGGRRSPVVRWLGELGLNIDETVQDCGMSYFTRYFRRQPDAPLPAMAIFAIRTVLDNLMLLGFTGDHDTYAITLAAASWDEELRDLRHDWAWDAVARGLPTSAPWAAPENGTPLCSVLTMTGHRNVRRAFIRDGEPVVLGLLPVGDALCTTNPAYGWGASMALTFAFAACEAIDAGVDDLAKLALRYDAAVAREVEIVYEESAASDRIRGYQWRGESVPEHDAEAAERQVLFQEGVAAGLFLDPVLARAFLRRINLVEPPNALFENAEVVERAERLRAKQAARATGDSAPTRDDVVAIIAAARPG